MAILQCPESESASIRATLTPHPWFKEQKVGIGVFGRGPENWHFSYLMAPAGQAPGEWAQANHCGGDAAGLCLKGAGADGPTVRAAV